MSSGLLQHNCEFYGWGLSPETFLQTFYLLWHVCRCNIRRCYMFYGHGEPHINSFILCFSVDELISDCIIESYGNLHITETPVYRSMSHAQMCSARGHRGSIRTQSCSDPRRMGAGTLSFCTPSTMSPALSLLYHPLVCRHFRFNFYLPSKYLPVGYNWCWQWCNKGRFWRQFTTAKSWVLGPLQEYIGVMVHAHKWELIVSM